MTKKDRSPPKNSASPNPRPKQRNKTPPPPPSASTDQDPSASSIVSTPLRNGSTNVYAPLQDDLSDDSKSTLNPDDESQYESAGEGSVIATPNISNKTEKDSK
jgi:hypothetical protein